jgi:pentapeptide MXKDX repeat protein
MRATAGGLVIVALIGMLALAGCTSSMSGDKMSGDKMSGDKMSGDTMTSGEKMGGDKPMMKGDK